MILKQELQERGDEFKLTNYFNTDDAERENWRVVHREVFSMIPVKQLVMSMRYSLKDMQAVNYSDFELVEAINHAAWQLYSRIAEQFVSAGLKKKILVVDESGSASLPTDFIKIHQVGMADEGRAVPVSYIARNDGKYRIIGDKFYAPEGAYGLEYYYAPARELSHFENVGSVQVLGGKI